MDISTFFIIFVILLCLTFDFTNGFHDGANSIATIIATGVLTPRQAVIFAAFFNFIAFFLLKDYVAITVATNIITPSMVNTYFIFAVMLGAIAWNLITWYFGMPSSSSHALLGGLVGAGLVKGGMSAIKLHGLLKIMLVILSAPVLGIVVAYLLTRIMAKLSNKLQPSTQQQTFKYLQLMSSAALSVAHGSNDAQKTMGIILLLLLSVSWIDSYAQIPLWVPLSCYAVIAIGTLFGGWRIVRTMAKKITILDPLRGSCAESAAALIILSATHFGFLTSTTHTVTGAVAGVGIRSPEGTHWHTMYKIFFTWIVTIPAAAAIAAIVMLF
jgi:PiT family inorganic phosphate transporter